MLKTEESAINQSRTISIPKKQFNIDWSMPKLPLGDFKAVPSPSFITTAFLAQKNNNPIDLTEIPQSSRIKTEQSKKRVIAFKNLASSNLAAITSRSNLKSCRFGRISTEEMKAKSNVVLTKRKEPM